MCVPLPAATNCDSVFVYAKHSRSIYSSGSLPAVCESLPFIQARKLTQLLASEQYEYVDKKPFGPNLRARKLQIGFA